MKFCPKLLYYDVRGKYIPNQNFGTVQIEHSITNLTPFLLSINFWAIVKHWKKNIWQLEFNRMYNIYLHLLQTRLNSSYICTNAYAISNKPTSTMQHLKSGKNLFPTMLGYLSSSGIRECVLFIFIAKVTLEARLKNGILGNLPQTADVCTWRKISQNEAFTYI